MLRRQRTFFLSRNQYEPVVLVYLGLNSGVPWFRFYHEDDATRYFMRYRTSNDRGQSWSEWVDSSERNVSNVNYTDFYLVYVAGLCVQMRVVMCGDEKDNSEPSNIVDAVIPAQPYQSPPVLDGDLYYTNGDVFAMVNVQDFPTGVSRFYIWRREQGGTEWTNVGWGQTKFTVDSGSENGKTYEYKAAWGDADGNLLSYYSNIVTVAVPEADITYLVPPVKFSADFFDYSGQGQVYDYWNRLVVYKGDMRSKGVKGQYRINNGNWADLATYDFAERGVSEEAISFNFWLGHTNRPTEGDVWQYRLKNYAEGYEDSVWSEIFEVTIPSLLPKLASPVVTVNQSGSSVVISWQSVENASGYRIERKLSTVADYTLIVDNLPASTTRYTDSGTWLENTYDIRVTALGDGQSYQNSNPTVEVITISKVVVLEAPVIDSVTESGINVVLTVSNVNTPNTLNVQIEMSENNGTWKLLGAGYPASMSETAFTYTVPGESILEGGNLRFRARAMPAAMAKDPSPYSEIASITIDEREWLLRWNGTSWDDPSGLTGGWINQNVTWSDEVEISNITETTPATGVKRLQGQGWYRTVNPLIANQGNLLTKYSRICMVGSLIKQVDGTSNHAWFGVAFTYPFAGGTNFDYRNGTYVYAGSESGRATAGTKVDPYISPSASSSYTGKQGPYLYFRFYNGYADIKGIYAIKR